jgi:hypothetical protein
MTHLAGHDRSQILLLPDSLDDYVGPENPVRFIAGSCAAARRRESEGPSMPARTGSCHAAGGISAGFALPRCVS